MEAVVVFDYEAQQDDELDLKVGDVIKDVQTVDEGWCEGVLKGKKGMFPDNFVQVREPAKPPPVSEANDVGATPIRGMSHGKKTRRAKVTFSYAADNIDELSLEPGQIVEVLEEEEEGWWRGKVGGKEGVFPSNFVEIVEEDESVKPAGPPATSQAPPPQQSAPPHRAPSPVETPPEPQVHKHMMGQPMMPKFDPSQALAKLKKSTPSNSNVVEPKKPAPPPSSVSRPPPPSSKVAPPEVPPSIPSKLVEKAKVTFDYEADNEDELTIRVGEIVEVVNKNTDNDGWWEVRLGERIGLIPDNFVEILPASPPTTRHQSASKPPPPAATTQEKPEKPAPVIPSKPGPTPLKKKPPAPEPSKKPPKPEPPKPEPHPPPPAATKPSALTPDDDKEGQDFGVPSTQPLDSSAVKSRPKKTSRPPSRSNLLQHLEEEGGGVLDVGGSSEPPAAAPEKPAPAMDKPAAAPWQRELKEKRKKAPLPKPAPKAPVASKPAALSRPTMPPAASKPAPRPEPSKPEPKPSPPAATTAKEPAPSIRRSDTPPVGTGRATPTPAAAAPAPSVSNNEWKEAFDGLQEEFAKFKKFVVAEIATLTDDLDKETKRRAALEVDIERLKKSRGFPH